MNSKKILSYFSLLAFLLCITLTSPSCAKIKRVVMGDPRKNCNHPKHGDYVRERKLKKQARY